MLLNEETISLVLSVEGIAVRIDPIELNETEKMLMKRTAIAIIMSMPAITYSMITLVVSIFHLSFAIPFFGLKFATNWKMEFESMGQSNTWAAPEKF